MSASNYLENIILNEVFNNTDYTPVATIYLALYTSNPTDADSGTEVTGGSYARQTITFGAASGGSVATDADITFSAMPSGTVTYWGVRDASTGGNLLAYGAFDSPTTLSSGDSLTVSSGDITISLD